MELHETEVEIEVGGVARTVTAASYLSLDETHAIHVPGVVAVIGRGVARYPAQVTLHRRQPGSPQPRGTELVVDSEGREWTYHLGTCVRNRQARIVAWDDVEQVTNNADQSRPVEKPANSGSLSTTWTAAVEQVKEALTHYPEATPEPAVEPVASGPIARVIASGLTPAVQDMRCELCRSPEGPFDQVPTMLAEPAAPTMPVCSDAQACEERRNSEPAGVVTEVVKVNPETIAHRTAAEASMTADARRVADALDTASIYGSTGSKHELSDDEHRLVRGVLCRLRHRYGMRGGTDADIDLWELGTVMIRQAALAIAGEVDRSDRSDGAE
jgi:hypothetical protein